MDIMLVIVIGITVVTIFTYYYHHALKTKLQKIYFDIKQKILKTQVIFSIDKFEKLKYVGGVDISFVKDDDVTACIALVVLDINTLDVCCCVSKMIKMNIDYMPGYLAFRETPHIKRALAEIKTLYPSVYPDVLMVDGNGRLHRKQFGLACQTGVLCDIPCIGVAKNLYQMDRVLKHSRSEISEKLNKVWFDIENVDGVVVGSAVRSTATSTKPIFVSEGHRISLETARNVVLRCCKYRIPEPIRLADISSREILRNCSH